MGARIGKTADGRYVPIEHPDAALLAYSQHDKVPEDVLKQLDAKQAPKSEDKQAEKPQDKTRRPRGKSAATNQASDDDGKGE